MLLTAVYEQDSNDKQIAKKNGYISHYFEQNIAYIYIDKKHQTIDELQQMIINLVSGANYDYQIDVESFVNEHFSLEQVLRILITKISFAQAKLFKKTIEEEQEKDKEISLYLNNDSQDILDLITKLNIVANAINKARNFQIMPENFLNSENLASNIVNDFAGINNLKLTVLTKKEITNLNMGLLLSVNQGSTHEPRVVIAQYLGDPSSKEKIVIVGKGITFDTGGVNTKGYHMEGMKYDMSGSVIAAYAVKSLAMINAKVNVACVMCITDNRINNDASLPENVYQSMSGKWVEVVDTDAEGRLVLADGIYYAADKLNATTIIDVATLTGSMLVALGNSYTGIWSTNDDKYQVFNNSAKQAMEKVWRMPLHEDYNKGNKGSKVADLANWSSKVRPDSSQAAMFLKEFTKDTDFIHCDVAGTADKDGEPQGELIATLVEYAINSFNK
nr:leucyl aminopeptidase family protein [Mycoplasma sp. NEAQ87857]